MRNKLYWGLGVLIILIIATGGFVFYQQWTEIQQLKDAAEADNPLEEPIAQSDEPIVSSDKPITKDDLPAADEGFKWVQHGDHWHQVQIDAPDEWQGEPHEPNVSGIGNKPLPPKQISPVTHTPKYKGELTFEVYRKSVSEAWQTAPRDKHGLLKQSLPQPPHPDDFVNEGEYQQASKAYIDLMRVEAKKVLDISKTVRRGSDE